MKSLFRVLTNILVIGLFVLTIALSLAAWVRPEFVESVLKWIEAAVGFLGYWNYAVIFFSSGLESFPFIGTAIPGQNILILTAGFYSQGHEWQVVLAAVSGAILWNALGYILGRVAGEDLLSRYGLLFGIGMSERNLLVKTLGKNGGWTIALGKFHGLFRAFLPFIAGTAHLSPRSFWLWNIIGSVAWAITMIALGRAFADNYLVFLQYGTWIVLAIFLSAGVYIYRKRPDIFQAYLADKKKEIEWTHEV